MTQLHVIPIDGFNLYAALTKKETELRRRDIGTWRRSGRRVKDRTKWTHTRYPGYVKIARGMGELVQLEVQADVEWQLVDSILGFLDRHFGEDIQSIHIFY